MRQSKAEREIIAYDKNVSKEFTPISNLPVIQTRQLYMNPLAEW